MEHADVAEETIVLHLQVSVAGDSLTGWVRDDDGATRQFDGRLGLLAAIDTVIDGRSPVPREDSP